LDRSSLKTRSEIDGLKLLKAWKFEQDSGAEAPAIWKAWFDSLQDLIWDEMNERELDYPRHELTMAVLEDSVQMGAWLGDGKNGKRMSKTEAATKSYKKTIGSMLKSLGPIGHNWKWGRVKRTEMLHAAKMPGFGSGWLSVNGGEAIVNATGQNWGPSCRIIVGWDKDGPVAKTILAGGQSGNPGSPYYMDNVEEWRLGKLRNVYFYKKGAKKYDGLKQIWTFVP